MTGPVIGFTGTRSGMTPEQRQTVHRLLRELAPIEFHHGDCLGADEEAHHTAARLQIPVALHPPSNNSQRAYCAAERSYPERPYLDRNRDIVNETSLLIAAPSSPTGELRSGTWATVRYARRVGCPVALVLPDGTVAQEPSDPQT